MMDAAHSREDAAAIVGELYRRRASLRSLASFAGFGAPEPRMPSLAALVDAVYRFDLAVPARGPAGDAECPERR